ncbi:hypothetical protein LWC34_30140 [Kibdelosporangium philippinense]|uniref:Uncharacterized protein n=1 Tax=Kibdelosporangium philippinense TaxID=211113 RepID=A0ABS8ZGV1_9PSEU|nr:hypothetical protein [Kibdelosporangium philippinense]MCE7007058.1 hypothetical protein [Kibdelosporangium philippinense]
MWAGTPPGSATTTLPAPTALRYYHQALTLRLDLDHTYEVANTFDNLGHPASTWPGALSSRAPRRGRRRHDHRIRVTLDTPDAGFTQVMARRPGTRACFVDLDLVIG